MFVSAHYQRDTTALLLCALLFSQSCQSYLRTVEEEASTVCAADVRQESAGDDPIAERPDALSVARSTSQASVPYVSSTSPEHVSPAAPSSSHTIGNNSRQDTLLLLAMVAQQRQEDEKPPAKRQRPTVESPTPPANLDVEATAKYPYDVFISHARKDRTTLAMPLHEALKRRGIKSFFDREEVWEAGEGPTIMKKAMENALCGVFILSPEFAAQSWPMQALHYFLRRQETIEQQGDCRLSHLLPVFYRLTYEECSAAAGLYDRYSGIFEEYDFKARKRAGETSSRQVRNALEKLCKYTGVAVSSVAEPEVLASVIADELCAKVEKLRRLHASIDLGRSLRSHYMRDDFALAESLFPEESPKHVKDLSCTLQVIVQEQGGSIQGQLRKELISIEALFTDSNVRLGETPRNIQKVLIIGNPGIGKTTLSKHLAYRWAAGTWGKELEAVYVLPVRNLQERAYDNTGYRQEATLATAIVNNCFTPPAAAHAYETLRQKIDTKLKESTTLVILDGLDERLGASESLITQAETGRHKLLLFSRSYGIEQERAMVDLEVEHTGLSVVQVRSYVNKVSKLSFAQSVELLSLLRRGGSIAGILQVPINLQILCFLWCTRSSQASVRRAVRKGSLPGLYTIVTRFIWERYASKMKALGQPLEDRAVLFDMLGRIGLESLKRGEILIRSEWVDALVKSTSLKYPDATPLQNAGFLLLRWLASSSQYQFPHLTFQEYFGGRWLTKQLFSSDRQVRTDSGEFWVRNKYVPNYGRLFSFVSSEVSKRADHSGIRYLLTLTNAGVVDTSTLPHLQLQVRLLNEWLCTNIEAEISESLPLLEKEFKIFAGLQEHFIKGICLAQNPLKDNDLLPLLVEMLEEFRSVAHHVVPLCLPSLLAACDPRTSSGYAPKICEDTVVSLSALSTLSCFKFLAGIISGVEASLEVRKVAISTLGSLAYSDATLSSQIAAFLRSVYAGFDRAMHQAAYAALNVVLSASLSTPTASPLVSMARPSSFGKEAWSEYFGEVGEEPPLPPHIEEMLEGACPFWPGRRARDTHLLVLIPAMVDGDSFTLDKLGALIQEYFPNNEEGYRYYDAAIKRELGALSSGVSYWLLLTRDILLNSRGRSHAVCGVLTSRYAIRTGIYYRLPNMLEVSTAILAHYVRTGERLLGDNPLTYTHCQEMLSDRCTTAVGCFGLSGFCIRNHNDDLYNYGVSCCCSF